MNKLVYPVPLSMEYMEEIREWRNQIPETLRTPYFLTKEQQEDYYSHIICARDSTTRYWAFISVDPQNKNASYCLAGMGGVENIIWESRIGEISVIVKPELRGKGYGKAIVNAILTMAFNQINLDHVFGECYTCGNIGFWNNMIKKYGATHTVLPARKYFNGKYWDSLYFTFSKDGFNTEER